MPSITFMLVVVAGYLLGSIPCGVIVTRLFAGEDVRQMGSGRTGSTNVMRVVGWKLGLLTGMFDTLKAAGAIWLAEWLLPGNHWAVVVAGLAAVLGHIYSIFIGFKGGAGGGPTVGAGVAMWPWTAAFVIPLGALVWYGVGYASVATISFSLIIIAVTIVRWYLYQGPWEYIVFGVGALAICLWTLRPNLKRLMNGTERAHGWRAKRQAEQEKAAASKPSGGLP
jgi:glycerol-3-phosphate acyltransferase PlsY